MSSRESAVTFSTSGMMISRTVSWLSQIRVLLLLLVQQSINSLQIPRGVYIHIPFCRRRCFYCNFPVVVVGERPISQQLQGEAYTAVVLREIAATLKADAGSLSELETVYFGGGTPSLLPVECNELMLFKHSLNVEREPYSEN